MGRRGPQPTPTAILEARGSWRAKGRRGEPTPEVCIPPCPSWVARDARKRWRDLARELVEVGVMTKLDAIALGLLANALSVYIKAMKAVTKDGVTATSKEGVEYQRVALGIANNAWDRVLKICREFGLSPASRTSLRVGAGSGKKKTAKGKGRFFKAG